MCPICEHLKHKCFRCSTKHLTEINDILDAFLGKTKKQTNPYFDRDDWEKTQSVPGGKVMEN